MGAGRTEGRGNEGGMPRRRMVPTRPGLGAGLTSSAVVEVGTTGHRAEIVRMG